MKNYLPIGVISMLDQTFQIVIDKRTFQKAIFKRVEKENTIIFVPPTLAEFLYFQNHYNKKIECLSRIPTDESDEDLENDYDRKAVLMTILIANVIVVSMNMFIVNSTIKYFSLDQNSPYQQKGIALQENKDNRIQIHHNSEIEELTMIPPPSYVQLKKILEQNANIPKQFHSAILEHIDILKKYDPDFDFRPYTYNLKNLGLSILSEEEMNQLKGQTIDGSYNYHKTKIYLRRHDNSVQLFSFTHELLHMSNVFYIEKEDGTVEQKSFWQEDNFGYGIYEILTSTYNSTMGYADIGYQQLQGIGNLLMEIIGEKELFKLYQESNVLDLCQELTKIDQNENNAIQLIGLIDSCVNHESYDLTKENSDQIIALLNHYAIVKYETMLEEATSEEVFAERTTMYLEQTKNYCSDLYLHFIYIKNFKDFAENKEFQEQNERIGEELLDRFIQKAIQLSRQRGCELPLPSETNTNKEEKQALLDPVSAIFYHNNLLKVIRSGQQTVQMLDVGTIDEITILYGHDPMTPTPLHAFTTGPIHSSELLLTEETGVVILESIKIPNQFYIDQAVPLSEFIATQNLTEGALINANDFLEILDKKMNKTK